MTTVGKPLEGESGNRTDPGGEEKEEKRHCLVFYCSHRKVGYCPVNSELTGLLGE